MTTDNSDFSTIGKRISASMKKYGISMRALANKLCITQPTVFKWCHDQSLPRLEQIAEMAGIFHVSPVWLAYGIREPDEGDRMLRLGSSVLVSALAGISGEGKLSAEDYLLVTVATDDMAPAISPGDTVIVNRTVRRVQESGVYLVNAPGGRMIRRFRRRLDGSLLASCDNSGKYPENETLQQERVPEVLGRVVSKVSVERVS